MGREIRRLTFATDGPHFGGAERYLVAMAQAARRRGIEARICWIPGSSNGSHPFASCDLPSSGLTCVGPEAARTAAGLIRSFRTVLKAQRPDAVVINASGRRRFWLLPFVARWLGIPCVWVHQMVEGRDPRRLPPRRLGGRIEGLHLWRIPQALRHRLAAIGATRVVALNRQDKEGIARWQRVPRGRIRVVPHGVDPDLFRFDPAARLAMRRRWDVPANDASAPPVIGTAGRLVAGKGVDLAIRAAAHLNRAGTACVLVIAGQGPDRQAMQDLAGRLGVAHAVRFAGFIEDMPAFYSALDVFALCSATESFGLVLAEAMACERPVVATPTAGACRLIDHGRTGWLLRSFEAAELARALQTLLRRPSWSAAMGRLGRESVRRHFSIDLTLDRTLAALGESTGRRGRRPAPAAETLMPAHSPVEEPA